MPPATSRLPIIRITQGTFHRHRPHVSPSPSQSSSRRAGLFDGLTFELPSSSAHPHNWCVLGPSSSGKTTFLKVLGGGLLCEPATARSYPYLSGDHVPARRRSPQQAVRYVGFDGATATATTWTFMSARYESRREKTDFSVLDFLLGNTELNPLLVRDEDVDDGATAGGELLDRVVEDLRLRPLLDLPVAFLSNGQGRRARIARALLTRPEVLLLDEPFLGLDPPTVARLGPLLGALADRASPRLVVSARPQDPLPGWITHLVCLRGDCQVEAMGPKDPVLDGLRRYVEGVRLGAVAEDERLPVRTLADVGRVLGSDETERGGAGTAVHAHAPLPPRNPDAEPLVEMAGCRVRYGDRIALGNWSVAAGGSNHQTHGLTWTVRRGERWGVFGPNGSGKTTLVSLLRSDHPQAYSLPIRLFGRSRLPGSSHPPLTLWDVQARIGHASPEVHAHMPRGHTIRRVMENAWAATFRAAPQLDDLAGPKVDAALGWFAKELRPAGCHDADDDGSLSWADKLTFGDLSFAAQRVALFLRCVIRNPDLVVLDEAFSGMDKAVRDKCLLFLDEGERKTFDPRTGALVDSEQARRGTVLLGGLNGDQALVCIAHVREEVPACVREWLCLPEAETGAAARFGRWHGPVGSEEGRWRDLWGAT